MPVNHVLFHFMMLLLLWCVAAVNCVTSSLFVTTVHPSVPVSALASPPVNSPTSLPQPPPPPPLPPPAPVAVSTAQSAPPPLSNGFHYTFV